jgi:indolepyruvate ferredoxin oxidoreductase alpha subunit
MGASIGQAIGIEKAGTTSKVVAVIGDSTFMHSGMTGLVDAVYNDAKITVVILDNSTTAMTGHQDHPGSGVSAQGATTNKVALEKIVSAAGVSNLAVVNAFDIKAVRSAIRTALDSGQLSVVIVRGKCAVINKLRKNQRQVDPELCNNCDVCIAIGCPSIKKQEGQLTIDINTCMGDECGICQQICPKKAISPIPGEKAP